MVIVVERKIEHFYWISNIQHPTSNMEIFRALPQYLVAFILEYDPRFVIKNGKEVMRDGRPLVIYPIDATDYRRDILIRRPMPMMRDNTVDVLLAIHRDKRLIITYVIQSEGVHYHIITYQIVTYRYNLGHTDVMYDYHISDPSWIDTDEQLYDDDDDEQQVYEQQVYEQQVYVDEQQWE
jgi:hypothetical protein